MSDQYGGPGPADERPGPYQGSFGSSGQQQPPYEGQPGPYGGQPGPYGGSVGPNPYSSVPDPGARPPNPVRLAATFCLMLGVICALTGCFMLTSAGSGIAKTITGDPSAKGIVFAAILISSAFYLLPAFFLRRRRRWARTLLIIVAVLGIVGGITALPASILGVVLHGILLYLMLQEPTRRWFKAPR